ncbi:MAG: metallopeptidase family protein [Candidatus Aminicenantes bacterium]|nr:metallopeptidase family protein [Candidatus Aminicenantes bacterium]
MDKKRFESLVEEAVESLPRSFRKRIENLVVMVDERPPRRRSSRAPTSTLLGLYHGVPLKDRGSYYGNVPPDVIVIYQEPIERISSSDDEIRRRVREVVLHEVGHYFGLSEKELREIEE